MALNGISGPPKVQCRPPEKPAFFTLFPRHKSPDSLLSFSCTMSTREAINAMQRVIVARQVSLRTPRPSRAVDNRQHFFKLSPLLPDWLHKKESPHCGERRVGY